jgi:hypothetical protein
MRPSLAAITIGTLLVGASAVSAQRAGAPMEMKGHHSMEGEVTKVDAKKGWVDVKTSEGTLIMHFPPDALTDVKKGDSVTVDLGIKDTGPAKTK